MPSPPAAERHAPDVLLTTAVVAGLIRKSVYTLQRARHDRDDLDMPAHVIVGARSVRYPMSGVFRWALARGVRLCWAECPLSFALPVFDAYTSKAMRVPDDLAGLVRRGRR